VWHVYSLIVLVYKWVPNAFVEKMCTIDANVSVADAYFSEQ
jgi:hypothetical protein